MKDDTTNKTINNRTNNSDKLINLFFGLIAILGFVYILLRAYHIQMTQDEAFSFYLVHVNYLKALGTTANTHWLNSIGMKIADLFNLHHVVFLRWHNVIAFFIYVFFLYKILPFFKTNAAKLLLISFFLINPYTLEYFSLARGYALSLSFFIAAIYFALKSISAKEVDLKNTFLMVSMGTISIAANYTALFQNTALFTFISLLSMTKMEKPFLIFRSKWIYSLLLYLFTLTIATINLLLVKNITNDLQFGGEHSFFTDTLNSMLAFILYIPRHGGWANDPPLYLTLASILFFAIVLFILLIGTFRKNLFIGLFGFLFLFNFGLNESLFIALDIPFPYLRTALILFPSMAFSILFFIDQVNINTKLKTGICISVFALMSLNFTQIANLNKSYEWGHHAEVKEILTFIKNRESTESSGKEIRDLSQIKILSDLSVFPIWRNYYSQIPENPFPLSCDFYYQIKAQENADVLSQKYAAYDYLICNPTNQLNLPPDIENIKLINFYPNSGVKLFEVIK